MIRKLYRLCFAVGAASLGLWLLGALAVAVSYQVMIRERG